jgi:hypothetical protein
LARHRTLAEHLTTFGAADDTAPAPGVAQAASA